MLELWIIFALTSAIFAAVSAVMAKKVLNNVDSNQMIFEEYLVMLVLILIFFPTNVDFLSVKLYWNLYLFKSFLLFAFTFVYFKLLKEYEISVISPLLNLSPVFLIIISSIFLDEIVTYLQLGGILIIMAATYFLEVNFHKSSNKNSLKEYFNKLLNFDWKVIWLGFFMLILISFCVIVDKLILRNVDVYTNMFFTAILIVLGLFSYYFKISRLKFTFLKLKETPLIFVMALFTFCSTFFILKAIAISTAMVSLIIPIKRTSTLFSSLFGGILFHDKHLAKKMIAVVFMLIGVFIIAL